MRREDAEEFTQSLGQIVGGSWRQIALAKRLGVPKALGLSVEEWVEERLGGYVRRSIEDRREAVKELAADGMSQRAIGEVLGVSEATVNRDIVTNVTGDESELSNGAEAPGSSVTNVTPELSESAGDSHETVQNWTAPLSAVAALAADEKVRAAVQIAEKRRDNRINQAATATSAVVLPPGTYRTIVCDPPWPMQKIEREVRPNQVGFDYPTMSEDELMDYPLVSEKAADEAHLWLWTTQRFLWLAGRLVSQWGFDLLCVLTWCKPGGFQPVGLPQYTSEFVILARRGGLPFLDTKNFSTWFQAPRREHSRKPDEFYDMVRRVSPGPRLEMFSREPREGFEQHGLELEHFSEGFGQRGLGVVTPVGSSQVRLEAAT